MIKASRTLVMAAAAVTLMAGCRIAPVYEVVDSPVVTAAGQKAVSMQDVEKAIVRAGTGLGWNMKQIKPGQMEGTLALRTHTATVNILYSAKTYSVRYKDSTNLNYDGTQIHSNYNGWVQRLDQAIKTQLVSL